MMAPGMDAEEFRRLGHRAVDLVADSLHNMPRRHVFTPMTPAQRQTLLEQPLPETGGDAGALLDLFAERVLPHAMGNGHPRFFGWVNSPPAPIGVLGDFLAAAMNPSCAGGDHAAIYLERCATRWLMELIGFPADGSVGLLVSGGSMASLTGLAAARRRAALRLGVDDRRSGLGVRRLALYTSTEGHNAIRKSLELLGLGHDAMRTIPVDASFRLDVAELERAIARDRAAGLEPFCVVASAGTVATGAIDPLDALADVCAREGLWLHVDGAYGALGRLVPARAGRYRGLERADSIALDPHKWLSVPVECGCVLVRDGALLRDTFSAVPSYLRTEEGKGFGGLPWLSEYGFQQTRGFRALKLWLVLQQLGVAGVRQLVSRHVELAETLAAQIDVTPDLERLSTPELSIVCFRYRPPDRRRDDAALDLLNKRVMETVQSEGLAFVTNATIRGRFALRACVLHFATTEADLIALLLAVRNTGRRLAG
jgi:glutamate/tyrosine decarboxylase-like PLP-dependent enzyme